MIEVLAPIAFWAIVFIALARAIVRASEGR